MKGQFEAKALKPKTPEEAVGRLNNDNATPYVFLTFQITAGEFTGKRVNWKGWLTDNARERTIESLSFCGARMADGDFTDLDGVDSNAVQIVVDEREYNSKQISEVQFVNRIGGVRVENQVGKSALDRLREQCRAAVLKSKGTKVAPATDPFVEDDSKDIPF
jgi:hypothetical protein